MSPGRRMRPGHRGEVSRPGVRGEVADPCRRARRRPLRGRPQRQGRRAPGPLAGRVSAAAEAMIGHTLVTKQTGPAGAGASRLRRGRLRHRPRTVFVAAGRSRQRPDHAGRLDRRRHGDRGSRREPSGENPARRRRSRHGHFRLPSRRLASGLGLTGKQASSFGKFVTGVYTAFIASTAPSSRSTRWSSPAQAR